jgi:hypothetical protein
MAARTATNPRSHAQGSRTPPRARARAHLIPLEPAGDLRDEAFLAVAVRAHARPQQVDHLRRQRRHDGRALGARARQLHARPLAGGRCIPRGAAVAVTWLGPRSGYSRDARETARGNPPHCGGRDVSASAPPPLRSQHVQRVARRATRRSALQRDATRCNSVQRVAIRCSALQPFPLRRIASAHVGRAGRPVGCATVGEGAIHAVEVGGGGGGVEVGWVGWGGVGMGWVGVGRDGGGWERDLRVTGRQRRHGWELHGIHDRIPPGTVSARTPHSHGQCWHGTAGAHTRTTAWPLSAGRGEGGLGLAGERMRARVCACG